MPRSQPWAPGSSEGREAQHAPVFIYLFEGPAFTQTGSDSLGAGRRGTLLPGPLMCERRWRDGAGSAAAMGCVCVGRALVMSPQEAEGSGCHGQAWG